MPFEREGHIDVDRSSRGLRLGVNFPVVEPGREVATADLVRRPPQRVERGRSLAATAGDLTAKLKRLLTGQELAPEDRPERLGVDRGSEAMGDVAAAASASWVAMPPCLIGKFVPSPAA